MPEQPQAETLPCPIEALPLPDIYTALGTQPQGLTHAEAAARLRYYGRNTIRTVATTPLVHKFLAHFTHLMALLLWVGGLLGFLAQMPQLGIAIWLVNLINGAFSFWQEYKPSKPRRRCGSCCRHTHVSCGTARSSGSSPRNWSLGM